MKKNNVKKDSKEILGKAINITRIVVSIVSLLMSLFMIVGFTYFLVIVIRAIQGIG